MIIVRAETLRFKSPFSPNVNCLSFSLSPYKFLALMKNEGRENEVGFPMERKVEKKPRNK